jgi:hypothetical protein
MSGKNNKTLRIQFLGQCIALGGAGVELGSTYPSLIKQLLKAEFPGVKFEVGLKPLAHPLGLKPLVRASLLLFKPDVMIISLPGIFASVPRPVNLVDMIAPEVLYAARSFLLKVRSRIRSDSALWKLYRKTPTLLPRGVYPPLAIDSYRSLVEEAVKYCQESSSCRIVLIGPGGFNEDAKDDWLPPPGIYKAVDEMVLQLGQQLNVPVINATEIMAEQDGSVYQPRTNVWSEDGHHVMAREIGYVIAGHVRAMSAKRRRPGAH